MLIRFLSYLASIIGARRYKPLLISCLAVVFTVTSISVLISTLSTDSSDAASRVKQEGQADNTQQSSSAGLNGFEQKTTKDQPASTDNTGQTDQASGGNGSDSSSSTNNSAAKPLEIALNTAMVTLTKDSPDSAVTIATADSAKVIWSITPENNDSGINTRIEQAQDGASNAVIRFHAGAITPGTYRFTVNAKNTANGQNASKTISVTVN